MGLTGVPGRPAGFASSTVDVDFDVLATSLAASFATVSAPARRSLAKMSSAGVDLALDTTIGGSIGASFSSSSSSTSSSMSETAIVRTSARGKRDTTFEVTVSDVSLFDAGVSAVESPRVATSSTTDVVSIGTTVDTTGASISMGSG